MRFDSNEPLRTALAAVAVTGGLFIVFMGYCALHSAVAGDGETSIVVSARWGFAAALSWSALLFLGWAWRHQLRAFAAASLHARLALFALATVPIAATDAVSMRITELLNYCFDDASLLPRVYSFTPRAVMLSAIFLLVLQLWEWRMARAPEPADSVDTFDDPWLDFPEAPLLRLRVADVLLIRSAGNYSEIVTAERTHLVRAPLSQLADRLGPRGFVRVHRQTVINASHVRCIARDSEGRATLRLSAGSPVPVGRSYRCAIDTLTRH